MSETLQEAYVQNLSTPEGRLPGSPELPPLLPAVAPLHKIVEVDAEIPGCPPIPEQISAALAAISEGRQPEHPVRNLCRECVRRHHRLVKPRREFLTDEVFAVMELEHIDPELCFLEQGVLCMGPATREGCNSRCVRANSPCRGCMGPTPDALEQGAAIVNALATVLPAGGLMFQEDVVGVGYRYSLPVSILARLQEGEEDRDG